MSKGAKGVITKELTLDGTNRGAVPLDVWQPGLRKWETGSGC